MEPLISEIRLWPANFAPRGWAFCHGQLMPISANSALFSIIGTTYGGDGVNSFALPDLRGRVPVGEGAGPGLSPNRLGQKGGQEHVTLTQANLPSHNHTATLHAEGAVSTSGNPTGNMLGIVTGNTDVYAQPDPAEEVAMNPASITVSNAGGGQSFDNEQPYLVLNFIIALEGIYPSRS